MDWGMVSYSHLPTFENYQEIPENRPKSNFCSPLRVKKPEGFHLKERFSLRG